jgi:hypothetical protein
MYSLFNYNKKYFEDILFTECHTSEVWWYKRWYSRNNIDKIYIISMDKSNHIYEHKLVGLAA